MAKNARFKTQGQRKDTSKGEKDVARLLQQIFKSAQFYFEYPLTKFTNTDNERLRCDIFCPTFNFVVEYQGAHHEKPVSYGNSDEEIMKSVEAFKERQRLDQMKRKLYEDAEVKYLEIDHTVWEGLKCDDDKRDFLMGLL